MLSPDVECFYDLIIVLAVAWIIKLEQEFLNVMLLRSIYIDLVEKPTKFNLVESYCGG